MTQQTKNWFRDNLGMLISAAVIMVSLITFAARIEVTLGVQQRQILQMEIDERSMLEKINSHFADSSAHFTSRDMLWRAEVTDWLKRIDAKLDRHMEQPNTPIGK